LHATIILYILLEWKKPDTQFKDFFDTMPKTFDEFPAMFDEKLMDMIKGTNLYIKT
jgi:hypothetical protein